MTTRKIVQYTFKTSTGMVTVQAMDQIGPEDCFDVLMRATLSKYATGGKTDTMAPIPRSVKDFMIRTNLFI